MPVSYKLAWRDKIEVVLKNIADIYKSYLWAIYKRKYDILYLFWFNNLSSNNNKFIGFCSKVCKYFLIVANVS